MNEKLTKDSLISKFTDGCKVKKDWKKKCGPDRLLMLFEALWIGTED